MNQIHRSKAHKRHCKILTDKLHCKSNLSLYIFFLLSFSFSQCARIYIYILSFWYTQIYINKQLGELSVYIKVKSKVGDHSRGWPEGSLFDSLLHQCVGKGATPFPGLLHFTLDPYLIMLSVKQGGIKYHFLSLWYDSTWANGEHSNR